jgi:TetR/AcrR family transcriptional regulator, cholesterol catabolism regulator
MAKARAAKPAGPASKPREREVLDVAARVFHARGYAASSVQAIADELGILKGSVYYYIDSKEDLLYQLLKDVHSDLGAILDEAMADADRSPLDRLYTYVEKQVEYAARNIAKIAIYYRDADQLSERHHRDIIARRNEHEKFVRGLIAEAQSLGQAAPDEDPRILANLIFGSFVWSYRWYDAHGPIKPQELAQTAARFAVRAVAVDQAPRAPSSTARGSRKAAS